MNPEAPRARRRAGRIVRTALAGSMLLSSARLAATVEEQRARLPPPARCTDPVEGIWRSHRYSPGYADWMIFTLTIRRAAPGSNTLTGTIEANFWTGGPAASEPPPCRPGLRHYRVDMVAQGALQGARIDFWGTRWSLREEVCPRSFHGYNLDHFTGTIEAALQEFQSRNNDGGRDIDVPTVFRRVRCFDPAVTPHPVVAPPPILPPARGGCHRG